jgi:hypothetical protein
MNKGLFKNLKFDLPSGLVVFSGSIPEITAGFNNSVLRSVAGVWKKQKIDSGYIRE